MTSIDFNAKNFGQARLVAKQLSLPINRILGQSIRLNQDQFDIIQAQISKLDAGYPLDYLLGQVTFCQRDFVINENVLIPRPSTEYWVNELVQELEETSQESASHTHNPVCTLVEIGTGSGVIGLTLAPHFDNVILSDISINALEVTKTNQKNLYPNITNISIIESDLLDNLILPSNITNWTLVANLPYVPIKDQEVNSDNKVSFEPGIALYSGIDGLDLTRKLINQLITKYPTNMPSQIWLELDPRNIWAAKEYIQNLFANSLQNIPLKTPKKWIYNILTDEDDFARVLVIKQITE